MRTLKFKKVGSVPRVSSLGVHGLEILHYGQIITNSNCRELDFTLDWNVTVLESVWGNNKNLYL